MTETPLLQVTDLHTKLQTARGMLRAVDGVSFMLKAGETLGVVGESGSGKSVLGRTVMGLITSNATSEVTGSVLLDGQNIHDMSPKQLRSIWGTKVGMVFQDPMTALNPVKKVGMHLTEGLRAHSGMNKAEARAAALDMLARVGIPAPERRFDQFPHEMSGGMRQRVVIAMALVNKPKLLIADEPTTALDVTVQRQILDLLDELQDEMGMATILVSHNLGVVAGRADRVAVMYGGRFVETAEAEELFDEPRHRYTNALLHAIPQLADAPHARLDAIAGTPPNMVNPPTGCRFAARCQAVQPECSNPLDLLTDQRTHQWACVNPVR